MDHKNSFSASYAAAGVDITAGYCTYCWTGKE